MKSFPRHAVAVFSLSALALLATGCKPGEKAATDKPEAATKPGEAAATKSIPGLATEKEQVSYFIGMQMGKQLEQVKDEVDLDTLVKAVKSSLAGEKLLLTDEQAQQIGEAFGQKMQAKQIAKMMAEAKKNLEDGQKFLAENAKKPGVKTTASGLQYMVITEGKGAKPQASDNVRVHYKGSLLSGKTFDSSYDRGEPATMPLGGVIPGWSEGLQLMSVGSKYKFFIPAALAYGEQGPPVIGPNATLVFEVELLDIVKQ